MKLKGTEVSWCFVIMKWAILTTFLVASLTQLGYTQEDICRKSLPDKISERCREKETCSECIAADPCCAWCTEKDFGGKRCDYLPEIEETCRGSHTFPTNKLWKIKDRELFPGSSTRDPIQIKPQEVSIEVKPNTPLSLKIKYKQAGDYPLDLYYLMDLSYTMENDKENLARLGDKLAEKMKKTTSKFQIGFGSFVDKVTRPFLNSHPKWLESVCSYCVFPYSFYNHMALNTDTKRFKEEVKRAQISANSDSPEGGLDALMQVISCQKEINWRETSRKLIVLATDRAYHLAGDGKIGGVVRPNDGNCHLNASGHYTEGTLQDYPSISQIRNAILKHNIIVIFAVTLNVISVYERLSGRLPGSTVGVLDEDSSNIVEMIEDQYKKIKSSVTLVNDAKEPIKVTMYSYCSGGTIQETNKCDNIGIGETVTFEAKIEITSCPEDRNEWNQTFHIYPLGLNERLTVDLRMLCECDCEKPWNQEKESDYCSGGKGTYECGICKCDKNRLGKRCQCEDTGSGMTADVEDTTACFRPNDTVECSGKGKCICGYCECYPHEKPDQKTTGQYCECDNFSCDRHNGQICGGPNQGICECGKCICLPGWKGNACDCRDSTETCISPKGEEVCSGHGVCECGKCICKQTEKEHYTGKFCEECVVCPGSCEKYKACAQCKAFQSGPLTKEECKECSGNYTVVKELQENRTKCYFEDDDGCRYVFTYEVADDNSVTIQVQEEKECPEPVNVLAIVLGIIGGIVAIGILTLLAWKILTFIHDSREYAKFLKGRNLEQWMVGQNPLYKKATTTFNNPSFGNAG